LNFRFTEFSEVRQESFKYHSFRGCGWPFRLANVAVLYNFRRGGSPHTL
jgi:hypothetical protein